MSDSDNNKAPREAAAAVKRQDHKGKGRVLLSQFQCKMASTEIAFHIATKELCRAPEVPNTWRKRARQRDTGRQRRRQREAPPPPRQAIAEWPSGYTMSSTMMVNVTISIATPLTLVFLVDRSLLLLLPCLFPRTKKTSSDYAEQERNTECVESSSTTNFSFGTWSSFSSSQGLELGLGESWHQSSKADSDSAQLEGDWCYKLMIQEWRKCRLQASAELASPQEPRRNIQKTAHWLAIQNLSISPWNPSYISLKFYSSINFTKALKSKINFQSIQWAHPFRR